MASRSTCWADVLVVELVGGTLTGRSSALLGRGVCVEPRFGGVGGSGTLLGPEGSVRRSLGGWSGRVAPVGVGWPGCWLWTSDTSEPPAPGAGRRGCSWLVRSYLENCTVDASIFVRSWQVTKGTWWMSRHQEPMKDVGGCDKPRGAVNRAEIRGFPNGATFYRRLNT